MKAAFLTHPLKIETKDIPIPIPKPDEVRIRLKLVGICGSDVHLFLGHRLLNEPKVIGHEAIGYVDAIGERVKDFTIQDRVVIEPNIGCNECKFCISGRNNICGNKKVIGLNQPGCFAEFVCLPASHTWKVPEIIHDLNAVTIEPTAVAVHGLSVSSAKPGDTIAIIGLGAIGLLLTQLAISSGYTVLVTEMNKAKVKMAIEIGAIECPVIDELNISDFWSAHNVVSVFECAGSKNSASIATAAAPRGSEIILLGLSTNEATFQPLRIVREGISILPSLIYNHPADYETTIELIKSGIINPSFIVSETKPLINLQSALEQAARGSDSKIVITI